MLTHGVPLKVVYEILGHSSIAITGDVYGPVSPDVSREAVPPSAPSSACEGGLTVVKRPREAVQGRSGDSAGSSPFELGRSPQLRQQSGWPAFASLPCRTHRVAVSAAVRLPRVRPRRSDTEDDA